MVVSPATPSYEVEVNATVVVDRDNDNVTVRLSKPQYLPFAVNQRPKVELNDIEYVWKIDFSRSFIRSTTFLRIVYKYFFDDGAYLFLIILEYN